MPGPTRFPATRSPFLHSLGASTVFHAAVLTVTFGIAVVRTRGEAREVVAQLESPPVAEQRAELWVPHEPARALAEPLVPMDPVLRPEPLPELPEPEVEEVPQPLPVVAEPVARRSFASWAPVEPEEAPEEDDAPPREVEEAAASPPEPAPKLAGTDVPETAPVLLPEHVVTPEYPPRAERLGWHGAVVCRLTVAPDGRVSHAEVEESSGHPILDEAALEAVRRWRFRPGTRGGEPVEMDVLKRVLFDLTS